MLEGSGFRLYCSLCGRPWSADREEGFRKEHTASLVVQLALMSADLGKLASTVLRADTALGVFATIASDPDNSDVIVKLEIRGRDS